MFNPISNKCETFIPQLVNTGSDRNNKGQKINFCLWTKLISIHCIYLPTLSLSTYLGPLAFYQKKKKL